ncbi:diaminopimelate epimerase [Candidatus Cytomitobacter primus]|uniref:Diaminopimelate epimerase n=1 Tax=Candidatus Cytomitobacter primus TaxID=2066024 RepID=A0A5C0UI94_9PROT|nr:diaminopimelate epimerase [Candidatus Cytomitobacter primus]QEK38664.1 diaminopimelate epimerase [Candidatus Cytomitobacter primus]
MKFVKAHGLGNDFIMIFQDISKEDMILLSDRKLGIGCDQVIQNINNNGQYNVRFWNQDGSEANLCGNGIRCLAQYYDRVINKFHTNSGIIHTVKLNNEQVAFSLPVIPVIKQMSYKLPTYDVHIGNEHIVIFINNEPDWDQITHDFQDYLSIKNIMCIWHDKQWNIRSWERGVGRTLACGSGTIAAACAVWENNKSLTLGNKDNITFHTEIGELSVIKKKQIWQIGPANIVANGNFKLI